MRLLSRLFEEREKKQDTKKISYSLSYCEFLGGKIKDLLLDEPVQNMRVTTYIVIKCIALEKTFRFMWFLLLLYMKVNYAAR